MVRGQPHVLRAALGRERMRGLVDAPFVVGEAERAEDRALDLLLLRDGEVAGERGVVDRIDPFRDGGDERDEPGLELVEHGSHLGRLDAGLEVVEERVVGLVDRLEAFDVPLLELDGMLEMRQEEREVGRGAGLLARPARRAPRPAPSRREARSVHVAPCRSHDAATRITLASTEPYSSDSPHGPSSSSMLPTSSDVKRS